MFSIKLALLLAILVAGFVGSALPLLRRGTAQNDRILGWGNALAAGIFLAAGLVHMLPDADQVWTRLGWDYPMAFVLAGFAFTFMLLVEHVVLPESAHQEVHAPSGERFAHTEEHRHDALSAYAVLTALSIHSLLAGLALGAQPELAGVLVISLAIIAHKSAAGFALGVSLRRAHIKRPRAVGLIAFFATMTPLGIAVGAVLGALLSGRGAEWFEGIFDALAAGTFLYIAVIDIVESEFAKQGDAGAKFAMVLLGIAVMALIAVWT